jgi:hypothetical protein
VLRRLAHHQHEAVEVFEELGEMQRLAEPGWRRDSFRHELNASKGPPAARPERSENPPS